MIDIKEVQRLVALLLKDSRNMDSYCGPAGWLGACPNNRHSLKNALERVAIVKTLAQQIEDELKKGL